MLSDFLIQDKFTEFDFDILGLQEKKILKKINSFKILKDKSSNELIQHIDENKYNLYEHEVKYRIFKDISSINKKNNSIELVLDIPINNNIISINKIKMGNKLIEYIKDIYVCVNDDKITTNDDFKNSKDFKSVKNIYCEKIINCRNDKKITLHIILKNNVINKIINKNIFVNYSFTFFKNKNKFIEKC